MLRMDIVTERRIKMTYKEFEMQVKTYLEENLGADVTVSTYTARKNNHVIPHFIYIQIMLYSVELKAA